MKIRWWEKCLCWLLILIIFTQTAFGSKIESDFWKSRRPVQVASLPTAVQNPPSILNALPNLKTLPKWSDRSQTATLSGALRSVLDSIPMGYASVQEVHDARQSPTVLPSDSPKIHRFIERKTVGPSDGSPVGPGPVILLQDVHLNREAQTNLSHVLQQLIDQKQISAVGVEGAFSPFDFTEYRAFANKEISKEVARDFLDKNLIAAPAFVGATSAIEPPPFIGIDDETSYAANVEAYRSSLKIKSAVQKKIAAAQKQLQADKKNTFSAALMAFDGKRTAYVLGQIGMGDYLTFLSQHAQSKDMPFIVEQFLEAYRMERAINFLKVEEERKAVVENLARVLSKNEVSDLVNASLAYKTGQLDFGTYHRNLKNLCEAKGLSLRRWPAFDGYIRYVLLADGIKGDQLFAGIDALEQKVLAQLVKTPEEKELCRASEWLSLTKKLIDFSLTANEWKQYCRGGLLTRPLNAGGPNRSLERNDSSRLRATYYVAPTAFRSFENFYKQADLRSEKMVTNLLEVRKVREVRHYVRGNDISDLSDSNRTSRTMALVVGGFHSSEITDALRKRNISYVVVTPKVTKVDSDSASSYLSVFSRETTPLDRLFAGEKLSVYPDYLATFTTRSAASPIRKKLLALAGFESTAHRLSGSSRVADRKIKIGDVEYTLHHQESTEKSLRKDQVRFLHTVVTKNIPSFSISQLTTALKSFALRVVPKRSDIRIPVIYTTLLLGGLAYAGYQRLHDANPTLGILFAAIGVLFLIGESLVRLWLYTRKGDSLKEGNGQIVLEESTHLVKVNGGKPTGLEKWSLKNTRILGYEKRDLELQLRELLVAVRPFSATLSMFILFSLLIARTWQEVIVITAVTHLLSLFLARDHLISAWRTPTKFTMSFDAAGVHLYHPERIYLSDVMGDPLALRIEGGINATDRKRSSGTALPIVVALFSMMTLGMTPGPLGQNQAPNAHRPQRNLLEVAPALFMVLTVTTSGVALGRRYVRRWVRAQEPDVEHFTQQLDGKLPTAAYTWLLDIVNTGRPMTNTEVVNMASLLVDQEVSDHAIELMARALPETGSSELLARAVDPVNAPRAFATLGSLEHLERQGHTLNEFLAPTKLVFHQRWDMELIVAHEKDTDKLILTEFRQEGKAPSVHPDERDDFAFVQPWLVYGGNAKESKRLMNHVSLAGSVRDVKISQTGLRIIYVVRDISRSESERRDLINQLQGAAGLLKQVLLVDGHLDVPVSVQLYRADTLYDYWARGIAIDVQRRGFMPADNNHLWPKQRATIRRKVQALRARLNEGQSEVRKDLPRIALVLTSLLCAWWAGNPTYMMLCIGSIRYTNGGKQNKTSVEKVRMAKKKEKLIARFRKRFDRQKERYMSEVTEVMARLKDQYDHQYWYLANGFRDPVLNQLGDLMGAVQKIYAQGFRELVRKQGALLRKANKERRLGLNKADLAKILLSLVGLATAAWTGDMAYMALCIASIEPVNPRVDRWGRRPDRSGSNSLPLEAVRFDLAAIERLYYGQDLQQIKDVERRAVEVYRQLGGATTFENGAEAQKLRRRYVRLRAQLMLDEALVREQAGERFEDLEGLYSRALDYFDIYDPLELDAELQGRYLAARVELAKFYLSRAKMDQGAPAQNDVRLIWISMAQFNASRIIRVLRRRHKASPQLDRWNRVVSEAAMLASGHPRDRYQEFYRTCGVNDPDFAEFRSYVYKYRELKNVSELIHLAATNRLSHSAVVDLFRSAEEAVAQAGGADYASIVEFEVYTGVSAEFKADFVLKLKGSNKLNREEGYYLGEAKSLTSFGTDKANQQEERYVKSLQSHKNLGLKGIILVAFNRYEEKAAQIERHDELTKITVGFPSRPSMAPFEDLTVVFNWLGHSPQIEDVIAADKSQDAEQNVALWILNAVVTAEPLNLNDKFEQSSVHHGVLHQFSEMSESSKFESFLKGQATSVQLSPAQRRLNADELSEIFMAKALAMSSPIDRSSKETDRHVLLLNQIPKDDSARQLMRVMAMAALMRLGLRRDNVLVVHPEGEAEARKALALLENFGTVVKANVIADTSLFDAKNRAEDARTKSASLTVGPQSLRPNDGSSYIILDQLVPVKGLKVGSMIELLRKILVAA